MANDGITRQATASAAEEREYPSRPAERRGMPPVLSNSILAAWDLLALHLKMRGLEVRIDVRCFLYWEEGNPAARVRPHLTAVLDPRWAPPCYEGGNLVWKEGRAPDFAMDLAVVPGEPIDNRAVCERIGVREYLLVQAAAQSAGSGQAEQQRRLRLLRLQSDGRYAEVAPDERGELRSETLGAAFGVKGERLVLRDTATGEICPTPEEVRRACEAETARADREARARKAAAARADRFERGRKVAAARADRLRRAFELGRTVYPAVGEHHLWLRSGGRKGARLDVSGRDLGPLDVSRWDLRRADFSRSNLREANLAGADLRGARLTGADLRGARLTGADLRGARLDGADLRAADLTDARVGEAELRGARTEGAKGVPLLRRLSRPAAARSLGGAFRSGGRPAPAARRGSAAPARGATPLSTVAGAAATSLQAPCGPSPGGLKERL